MSKTKKILLTLAGFIIVALMFVALKPAPVPVSTTEAQQNYFAEYVEDEGFTVVRHTHHISSPITGYLQRISLEPGDRIQAGQAVFRMEPLPAPALDPRGLQQAKDRLEAARARLDSAKSQYERAGHEADLAKKEFERISKLYEQNAVSRADLDRAKSSLDQNLAVKRAAKAAVETAGYELENARSVLEVTGGTRSAQDTALEILSPVTGLILRRARYQEGVVHAGEIIMEVGSLDHLEVQADFLSIDAVRIQPDMRAVLEHWGGEKELQGRVRLVEPAGFKRVSALGVDEQRVPVLVEITSPGQDRPNLGHGFRVEVKIILWEEDQVLQIPTSSLFRYNDQWMVFVVENGRASQRQVDIGRRSGLKTQILDGLDPGETVIVHPGDRIEHGIRVNAQLVE